ncbi:hypothetical protein [Lactobacillus intestinalis]|mgnify:CR=1 FL=1|uniref:Uncharacterized protein n=1 Tax=Lactobacillus intestinalis TaxID=151781 RepID=A0A4S2BRZ4_9LACO|nr:hypothetical protein [Lactobacillus intestinalis]KAI4309848.1 hypothetical protein C821_001574 [Lactobacillus intestinalis]TGY17591.1 hypothetical protein E5351_00330 [Lactobacillus intestinalis]
MVESKKTKTTANKTAVKEPTFTKLGLKMSNTFNTTDKDIINIVLEDNKEYTLAQVKQAIKKFKEGI